MVEPRQEFEHELEGIEAKVIELFAMVAEDLPEGRQMNVVFAGPGEPRVGENELELDDPERV